MIKSIVLLISCGKRKSDSPCPAREMYNSERFTLLKNLADQLGCDWYIISAKYGLLHPDRVIEPYDLCLTSLTEGCRQTWAREIVNDLKRYNRNTTFVVLANNEYSSLLSSELSAKGYKIIAPFALMTEENIVTYLKGVSHINHIKMLYSSLNFLVQNSGGVRLLKECNGKLYWPSKGVYFIYDNAESSIIANGCPRIVRVGTHAVSIGAKSTLWGRLKTHKGLNNGGGSHRSSVFRLHVGNALINRDNLSCDTWGVGQNACKEIRQQELFVEEKVSEYIGDLGVAVLAVDDEASALSDRAYLERNIIALLSSINYSFEFPTTNWLGLFSPKDMIRLSSLWNINCVRDSFDDRLFAKLNQYIDYTIMLYKNEKV